VGGSTDSRVEYLLWDNKRFCVLMNEKKLTTHNLSEQVDEQDAWAYRNTTEHVGSMPVSLAKVVHNICILQ